MPFTPDDIRANRDFFAHKLKSEKQRNDVLKAVDGKIPFDFLLLDARGKEAFNGGHIPGAWCMPDAGVDAMLAQLPKEREIVTYCWGHD